MNKIIVSLILACFAATGLAATELPAVSYDGLHLVPHTKVRAVYMKPGADLSQYDKVALLKTYVAFAKHWQQDYNEDAPFDERVSDQDMQEIRDRVAKEFTRVFTEVLSKGGHQIVTTAGTGVLILRPAIVDLEITAPDIMAPDMSQTLVASAGSMTLYLELYDGKTQAIIARVIDPEAADDAGIAEVSNRVTNTADFDRVVRRWAELLNAHLGELMQKK